MSSSDLDDVKKSIRAVLVSSKCKLSVNDMNKEYSLLEGQDIPFRRFGYRNIKEFLLSIPDTVRFTNPCHPNSIIEPITSSATAHVQRLVSEQKSRGQKPLRGRASQYWTNYSRMRFPRLSRKEPIPFYVRAEIRDLLEKWPEGMPYHLFEEDVRRLLCTRFLFNYTTDEVLSHISEFAYRNVNKVQLKSVNSMVKSPPNTVQSLQNTVNAPQNAVHFQQNTVPAQNSVRSQQNAMHSLHVEPRREIVDAPSSISDEEIEDCEDVSTDFHEDYFENSNHSTCFSRPESRCGSSVGDKASSNEDILNPKFIKSLRNLLEDEENANGIWLNKLGTKFKIKYGYYLNPKEYGFRDIMDLVQSLPSVFSMHKFRFEGDYILRDARKFGANFENSDDVEIPLSLIDEVKKLLKNKKYLYTDELSQEYEKRFHKSIKHFGFKNMDSLLISLEQACTDFKFRTCGSRTQLRLDHIPEKADVDESEPICVEEGFYNPIPKEACRHDFRLRQDSDFERLERSESFIIALGEIYSPGRFYIHFKSKIETLEIMMADLHEFYEQEGSQYKVYPATVARDLLCACKYHADGRWHRVRVVRPQLRKAKVNFIDYGTDYEVDMNELRYLHLDFAELPVMCKRARLAGVRPKDDTVYGGDAMKAFYELTKDGPLDAQIVNYEPNCLEIFIHLTHPTLGIIAVHEKLISLNLVSRKEIKENCITHCEDFKKDDVTNPQESVFNVKEIPAVQNHSVKERVIESTGRFGKTFVDASVDFVREPPPTWNNINVNEVPIVHENSVGEGAIQNGYYEETNFSLDNMSSPPIKVENMRQQILQGPPPGFSYQSSLQEPVFPTQFMTTYQQNRQVPPLPMNQFQNLQPVIIQSLTSPQTFLSERICDNLVNVSAPSINTFRPPPGFGPLVRQVIPNMPTIAYFDRSNGLILTHVNPGRMNNGACSCNMCPSENSTHSEIKKVTRSSDISLEKFMMSMNIDDALKSKNGFLNGTISKSSPESKLNESSKRIVFDTDAKDRFESEEDKMSSKLFSGLEGSKALKSERESKVLKLEQSMFVRENNVISREFVPKMLFAQSADSSKLTDTSKLTKLKSIRDIVKDYNKKMNFS